MIPCYTAGWAMDAQLVTYQELKSISCRFSGVLDGRYYGAKWLVGFADNCPVCWMLCLINNSSILSCHFLLVAKTLTRVANCCTSYLTYTNGIYDRLRIPYTSYVHGALDPTRSPPSQPTPCASRGLPRQVEECVRRILPVQTGTAVVLVFLFFWYKLQQNQGV